jgi:hypothetical protein
MSDTPHLKNPPPPGDKFSAAAAPGITSPDFPAVERRRTRLTPQDIESLRSDFENMLERSVHLTTNAFYAKMVAVCDCALLWVRR